MEIAYLCGAKQTENTKSTICTLDSIFLVNARWIIVTDCNLRVHSDSDGLARPSPVSRKLSSFAKRCILHALRHRTHSLIIVGTPMDKQCCCICHSVQVWLQTRGTCSGPRLTEKTGLTWRKVVHCWSKEIKSLSYEAGTRYIATKGV